ncbi:hypothetical protein LSH36_1685g00030 [Paralvinella palmiformis]|uniref:MULE transposase domain-containing protein n=1 Tax=Paralvinella palmiformis TaxID=53620 RepID=A0AAD9MQV6_9ANNE|nr:hypothetical protein LSH36_1685g00030 [Paralvinella palmiformis]
MGPEPKPQQFLIFDNGPDTDSWIIVFGASDAFKYLSTANTWYMDGNHAVAPRGLCQLYIMIRCPLGNTAVSAIQALLQRKSQDTYENLLHAIVGKCSKLQQEPDPLTVVIDFETHMMRALIAVFGDHIAVHVWKLLHWLKADSVKVNTTLLNASRGELPRRRVKRLPIVDNIFTTLLSNSIFVSGVIAFPLDNIIPGTRVERGLVHWKNKFRGANNVLNADISTYDIPHLGRLSMPWTRYLPFCQTFQPDSCYGKQSATTILNSDNIDNSSF